MAGMSVLVWSGKSDAIYREARHQITAKNGIAPKTVKTLDFSTFFAQNNGALVYFPVFQGTAGWWGELLGTGAKIQAKIVVSPECQLYEIGVGVPMTTHQLFAAEIEPKFITKIRETAISIKDMIATDSGTILTLLVASNENKIKSAIKTASGEYFGSMGGY